MVLNNSQCLVQNFSQCWTLTFDNLGNAPKKFLVSQEGEDVLADTFDGAGPALTRYIGANGLEANFTFPTVISQTCLGADKWISDDPELRYNLKFCKASICALQHFGSLEDSPTPLPGALHLLAATNTGLQYRVRFLL